MWRSGVKYIYILLDIMSRLEHHIVKGYYAYWYISQLLLVLLLLMLLLLLLLVLLYYWMDHYVVAEVYIGYFVRTYHAV